MTFFDRIANMNKAIFTWIIVAYNIVTVRVPKFNEFYHIIAILALDAFMIIMWLATWARAADVAAALGAASRYYSIFERSLETRALSWTAYKGIYGALAGLGALMWLSWIGTFVFTLMAYLKGKKEGRFPLNNNPTTSEAHQMEEAKAQPAAAPAAQPVYAAPQPGYEQNPYEAPQAHPQQHQQ